MKKTITISMALMLCFLVSSCGFQSSETKAQTESNTVVEETVLETKSSEKTTENETTAQTEPDSSGWAAVYKKYLLGKYKKAEQEIENGEYEYMPYSTFALYYIDDDDVPEIMVTDDGSHIGTATLITYSNGIAKAFSGLGSNGVVYFRERENVIVGDYIGSGTHGITVYHLANGSLVTDWESTKLDSTWFENGGTIEYYTYNAVVDAEEYQEQYDQFVPTWYDPMGSGIDALPETDWDSVEHVELKPEEIEKYFNQW